MLNIEGTNLKTVAFLFPLVGDTEIHVGFAIVFNILNSMTAKKKKKNDSL
jgi:hypothetical protein